MSSRRSGSISYWWCGNDEARVKSFQYFLVDVVRELLILEHCLHSTDALKKGAVFCFRLDFSLVRSGFIMQQKLGYGLCGNMHKLY